MKCLLLTQRKKKKKKSFTDRMGIFFLHNEREYITCIYFYMYNSKALLKQI